MTPFQTKSSIPMHDRNRTVHAVPCFYHSDTGMSSGSSLSPVDGSRSMASVVDVFEGAVTRNPIMCVPSIGVS